MIEYKHCDEYIKDKSQPKALRKFLLYKRIPAAWQIMRWKKSWGKPKLFAKVILPESTPKKIQYDISKALGKKDQVRVVMASRLGDVGITTELEAESGYMLRVPVEWLTDFRGDHEQI